MPTEYGPSVSAEDFTKYYREGDTIEDVFARANPGEALNKIERTPKEPSSWDPQRVTALYDFAHSPNKPPEFDDNVIKIIDAANTYVKTSGGAALPSELIGMLNELDAYMPVKPVEQEAQPVDSGFGATGPFMGAYNTGMNQRITNAEFYGLTQEQYDSLSLGKKIAMTLTKTSAASGGLTGAMAGLQSGNLIGGAVAGTTLGSLAGKFPWLGEALDKLDWFVENLVMKPIGTAAIGVEMQKRGRFQEYLNNLDKAWVAGEQVAKVSFIENENATFLERLNDRKLALLGPVGAVAYLTKEVLGNDEVSTIWAGPNDPLNYNTLTPEQQSASALVEYYDRLVAGERPEDINRDFDQRYGYQGAMTDLGTRIFLDPLNIAGPVMAKSLGKLGKLAGASSAFVESGQEAKGLIHMKELYGIKKSLRGFAEWKELGTFEKWLDRSWDAAGNYRLLTKPGDHASAVGKFWDKTFGYVLNQTKESRAKEFASKFSQVLPEMFHVVENNPIEFMKLLRAVANDNVKAATDFGMQSLGGPETTAMIPMLRDVMPHLEKILGEYTSDVQKDIRKTLGDIKKITNEDVGLIVKNMNDPEKGADNIKLYAQKLNDAGIETDPAVLTDMAKVAEDGLYTDDMLGGKLAADLISKGAEWSAKYFGVAPDAFPYQISNFIKNITSFFVLDLNPSYLMQNPLDNTIKLSREGLIGIMTPTAARIWVDKFYNGMLPARLAEGFLTDTAQIEHMEAIAQAKRHKGKGVRGKIQRMDDSVSAVRRKVKSGLDTAKIGSGYWESNQRLMGNVIALREVMAQFRPGHGFDEMSPALLQKIGNGVASFVYDKISRGGFSKQEIMDAIFVKEPSRSAADAVGPAAQQLKLQEQAVRHALDKLHVTEWLDENIKPDMDNDAIRMKFVELSKHVQDQLNIWSREQLLAKIDSAKATYDAEGVIGLMSIFDEIGATAGETRMTDTFDWQHLWELQDTMSESAFDSRVQLTYGIISDRWRNAHQNIKALYLGVLEKLGASTKFSEAFGMSLFNEEQAWAKYFDYARKKQREFMKKVRGKGFEDKTAKEIAWNSLRAELRERYNKVYHEVLDIQRKRNKMFVTLMKAKAGDAAGKAAQAWRDGQMKIDQDMFNAVERFRETLDADTKNLHQQMWMEFYDKEYRPMLLERQKDNLVGARVTMVEYDRAERAGELNPNPEQVETESRYQKLYDEARKQFYNLSEDEINASFKLIEARASSWVMSNPGKSVDDWYASLHFNPVKRSKGGVLQQVGPEDLNAYPYIGASTVKYSVEDEAAVVDAFARRLNGEDLRDLPMEIRIAADEAARTYLDGRTKDILEDAGPGIQSKAGEGNIILYRTARDPREVVNILGAAETNTPGNGFTPSTSHIRSTVQKVVEKAQKKGAKPVYTSNYPSVAGFYQGWHASIPMTFAMEVPKSAVLYESTRARATGGRGVSYSLTYADTEIIVDASQVVKLWRVPDDLLHNIMGWAIELSNSQARRTMFRNAFTDADPALAQAGAEAIADLREPPKSLGRPFLESPVDFAGGQLMKGDRVVLATGDVITVTGYRKVEPQYQQYNPGVNAYISGSGWKSGYLQGVLQPENIPDNLVMKIVKKGERITKAEIAMLADQGRFRVAERIQSRIDYLEERMSKLPEGDLMRRELGFAVERAKTFLEKYQPRSVEDTLFQDANIAQPWYSKLERVVDEKMQAKTDAVSLKNMLIGAGVKQQEMFWTGLDEFLEGKKSVTKQEVQDFLEQNRVEVREIVKSDAPPRVAPLERLNELTIDAMNKLEAAGFEENEAITIAFNIRNGRGHLYTSDRRVGDALGDTWNELQDAGEYVHGDYSMRPPGAPESPTKYSGYKLPGGENYRELLLTLPPKKEIIVDRKYTIESRDRYGDWVIRYDDGSFDGGYGSEAAASFDAARRASRTINSPLYSGPHWSEDNVLVHVRFQEFVDADGKKVLYVEEIQSDWHQAGRERGYIDQAAVENYRKWRDQRPDFEGKVFGVANYEMGGLEFPEKIAKIKEELSEYYGPNGWQWMVEEVKDWYGKEPPKPKDDSVPLAPFADTKEWSSLAMKRMVRWAAENGYDRVGWTTGKLQFDRWGSERFEWKREGNEWRVLGQKQYRGNAGGFNLEEEATARNLQNAQALDVDSRDRLYDVVEAVSDTTDKAKIDRITDKLWARMQKEDTGVSMPRKEGMEEFYDVDVRSIANKIGKKFDAKVGETKIVQKQRFSTYALPSGWDESGSVNVHYLDVTPEMKNSVLYEGQTMWQPGQKDYKTPRGMVQFLKENEAIIQAFSKHDVSTLPHEVAHVFRRQLNEENAKIAAEWSNAKLRDDGTWEWTKEAEEKFANGFLKYLKEGKAPTEALAEVFKQFKQWLTKLWKTVRDPASGVVLDDKIRKVYDSIFIDPELKDNLSYITDGTLDAQQIEYAKNSWSNDVGYKQQPQPVEAEPLLKWKDNETEFGGRRWKIIETDSGWQPYFTGKTGWEPGGNVYYKSADEVKFGLENKARREQGMPEISKVEPQPATPAADPLPVGDAAPGTVAGISGEPYFDMLSEGWEKDVMPMLRQMEGVMADQNWRRPTGVKNAQLDPQTVRDLSAYVSKQAGGKLADYKLYATKYAENMTDRAMLNYNMRVGFDDLLNMAVPYQFYMTRTGIRWALTAIDRPYYFAWWARVREMQEKFSKPTPGIPARLAGKMRFYAPFLPDGWGDSIYIDPWHQVFNFEAMLGQVIRPLVRDYSNRISQAERTIIQMVKDEQISEEDGRKAIATQYGPIWDAAYQKAVDDVQSEITSPMDLVDAMSGLSMPLKWFLSRKGMHDMLDSVGLGALKTREPYGNMGSLPTFRTIQGITSLVVPGGVNIPEFAKKALGIVSTNDRGQLWDYYMMKELSNMAGRGASTSEVLRAMVERKGDLWTQAQTTVGHQQFAKSFMTVFWGDFFPEGEQEQIELQQKFKEAVAKGPEAIAQFWDDEPEFEARLSVDNWDDPEQMLKNFVRSGIWDAYNALDPLQKEAVQESFGDLFMDSFLSRETRSYDSIDTETMVQWLRQLNGYVPENAPQTPQVAPVQMPSPEINSAYNDYVAWRDAQPGYALAGVYYNLPQGMQSQFRMAHPEVQAYLELRYVYGARNPEVIPYMISEDNRLAGASPELQQEVFGYYAERAELFPLISLVQDNYYALDKKGQRQFLKEHPELKEYWNWARERKKMLSNDAYFHVESEEGIKKLREGGDYEKSYYVDYDKFSPDVLNILAQASLLNRKIGPGTNQALYEVWVKEKKPLGSFEAWLMAVMDGLKWR